MSSKLTEQKIEQLIEELLQEKINVKLTNYVKDMRDAFDMDGKDVDKSDFKLVGSLDGTDADITNKDFEIAYGKKKKDGYKPGAIGAAKKIRKHNKSDSIEAELQSIISNISQTTATTGIASPDKVGDIADIDMDTQVYQPDSMAFGKMANIGSQSGIGQFPEGVSQAVKKLFDGTSTFKERIDKLSAFSANIFKNTDLDNADPHEVLAATLIMDYLTTIVKEMDSGSGAYMFETLCATLAGGTVAGKGDVDTTGAKKSGIMGAVDFTFPTSAGKTGLGSSKYYTSVGSTNISQALSGFVGKKGETILYIVAHKKEDLTPSKLDNIGASGATADPTKILAINIHMISVMPLVDSPVKAKHFKVQVNGGNEKYGTLTTDGRLAITDDVAKSKPILLQVAAGGGETFKKAFKKAQNSKIANFADIKKNLELMMKEFYLSSQKSERYLSSGKTDDGDAALESYDRLGTAQNNLFSNLSGTAVADIEKDRTLEESKLHSLDDLIAETMRDIKRKRKK